MSTENKLNDAELLKKLQHAQALLDECIAAISRHRTPKHSRGGQPAASARRQSTTLDFDANERAFMKGHAKHLSGAKKFAVVSAYLAKGDAKKEIQLRDIESTWNRMTAILGEFNRKYSNDAKEQGWVNTKKKGVYILQPQWRNIIPQ